MRRIEGMRAAEGANTHTTVGETACCQRSNFGFEIRDEHGQGADELEVTLLQLERLVTTYISSYFCWFPALRESRKVLESNLQTSGEANRGSGEFHALYVMLEQLRGNLPFPYVGWNRTIHLTCSSQGTLRSFGELLSTLPRTGVFHPQRNGRG